MGNNSRTSVSWSGFMLGCIVALFLSSIGDAKAGTYCEPQSPRTSIEGTRCVNFKWDSKSQKVLESRRLLVNNLPKEGNQDGK